MLVGGVAPAALDRAGRLGDGFLALAHPPAMLERLFAAVVQASERAGQTRRPRFVGAMYFALGEVADEARSNLRHAYAPAGAESADRASNNFLSDRAAIRAALDERRAIGMDEVFLWPAVGRLDQIERLAEVVA